MELLSHSELHPCKQKIINGVKISLKMKRNGIVLMETVLAFIVFVSLFVLIINVVGREIHAHAQGYTSDEIVAQLDFAKNYLVKQVEQSQSIVVKDGQLVINQLAFSITIGVKNHKLYKQKKAIRYLTLSPVYIESVMFEQKSSDVVDVSIISNGPDQRFYLKRQ
jgi:hypothetical protein